MSPFDLACAIPWCITEDALTAILTVANLPRDDRTEERWEAIASRMGKPLEHASRAASVDESTGIARISIDGPIFRKANLLTRYSGATSTDVLMRDITTALADPAVRALVLSIDSPGGEAHGTHDAASLVRSARAVKPVVAHVWGQAASGAYWIASAADSIVASPMALLGSIGAIATLRDRKDPEGTYHFVSSVSPYKRADLKSDAGRARIQATIDALGAVFAADVARNRDVPLRTVLRDFGAGDQLVGESARRAHLCDSLGTYQDVEAGILRRLAGQVDRHPHLPTERPSDVLPQPVPLMGQRRDAGRLRGGDVWRHW
jgi:capsid assembly protease